MTAITSIFAGLQGRRPLVQPALMTSRKNYVKIPGRPGFRALFGAAGRGVLALATDIGLVLQDMPAHIRLSVPDNSIFRRTFPGGVV